MRTLVVMAVLAAAAFGFGEFGVQLGYWIPTGDAGDAYEGNIYFGAQYLYHMAVVAVEASAGYLPVKFAEELEGYDYSGRIIPLTLGLRSYSSRLYAAGGLELDIANIEVEGPGYEFEDSDSELGAYVGGGMIVPAQMGDIDLSVRLHFMDFDDMWIGIQGGINF
jgi:hypothetical protein